MKYTLIFVAAVLAFTACKKKQDKTSCYVCTRKNSVTSNIAALAAANAQVYTDTICNYNDDRIRLYEKDHTYRDTAFTLGDTITYNNWSSTCIID